MNNIFYFYSNFTYDSNVYEVRILENNGKKMKLSYKLAYSACSTMKCKKNVSVSGFYYAPCFDKKEPYIIEVPTKSFEKGIINIKNEAGVTMWKMKKVNEVVKDFMYYNIF